MRFPRFFHGGIAALLMCCLVNVDASPEDTKEQSRTTPATEQRTVDFVKDIQPLLRKNCYSCHGAEMQESGLRLDMKQRALDGGDNGAAIVPDKADESRLLRAVAGDDKEVGLMPPDGEGTPLTQEQVALLRAWINQGAVWPAEADARLAASDHWSFQPIRKPERPTVRNESWPRNEIDYFVLARLEKDNIQPSPEADRATLIRRLYLDLLGLPPTPQDVNQFLSDNEPDAYGRLVDRVLRSEHYGERWARHWLDLARYADSDGYEKDRPRPNAWRYRQWVIDALNADMPFDQFTIEQIAGDMLPDATTEQLSAVGFHRNTLHNTEGGTDQEEDRVKKTIDRTNTTGATWLGLTVGCAQCHSHKYDPITQREYYSLYALFNYIAEKDVPAPTVQERAAYEQTRQAFDAEQAKRKSAVEVYVKQQLPAAQAKWEVTALTNTTSWTTVVPKQLKSAKGATFTLQDDQSVLVTGKNEKSDVYTVEATTDLKRLSAIRLEVLPDASLPKNGPGRADNGNFVLTTFRVSASQGDGGDPRDVKLKQATADFSQNEWNVALAINDNAEDGWAVSPEIGKRHVAVFELVEPLSLADGAKLTITLDQTYNGPNAHNIGRFRIAATDADGPIPLEGLSRELAEILNVDAQQRTAQQQSALAAYYRTIDAELAKLQNAIAEHAKQAPSLGNSQAQSIVQQAATTRDTRVFPRGDFLRKNEGAVVGAGVPSVLPPLKPRGEQPDRLDLARWIVDPGNPLTARVTVNRVWQRYIGRGIVATSDDFGTQGEPPSHPELLDWLASEFRDGGWRLKSLHRLIVTSATYRQSSAARKDLLEVDPQNVLLARQPRRRVEAEVIRDLALAASGLLDSKIGGPSVRPPQPAEYSQLTYANSAKWQTSKGGDAYRRGLYTFFQRTSPYPMLMTFDSPDSTECTAQRSLSNTPLQALTLWNDRVFFECAQNLARRVVLESPPAKTADQDDRSRAVYAFQLCLARQPNSEELDAVVSLFKAQRVLASADMDAATKIVGSKPLSEAMNVADLAGWVMVGRALMNLDEFITRE